jgi:hypothetical protein
MNTICFSIILSAALMGDAKTPLTIDFEDADVGKLPAGWSSAKTGKAEGSVWTIAEDKTAPKGPKVLAQTASGPGSLFNLCIADKTRFADIDLTVSFKSVAGKKDQGGGPLWRYKDPNNYYVVRMNPLEDNFRLYKIVDGKRTQLATTPDDVVAAEGKWHTIRVVHQGNRIQCFFNDKKHFDLKDDTFKDAGKIGVWTKADAQTYFDNIVIRK